MCMHVVCCFCLLLSLLLGINICSGGMKIISKLIVIKIVLFCFVFIVLPLNSVANC